MNSPRRPMCGISSAPIGGPRLAAIGWDTCTVAIAEPIRWLGVIIAWVAMMTPPDPWQRPISMRDATNHCTSAAQAAIKSAAASNRKVRTMIGRREKRSASAPQKGAIGIAIAIVIATSSPVQVAISAGASPRSCNSSGVKAVMCPSAAE